MTSGRIRCILGMLMVMASPPLGHAQVAPSTPDTAAGSHGFDFLLGDFRVHHRVRRPDPGQPWLEFDGTASQRALLGGGANVQEYVLNKPGGMSYGAAIRAYDPKARQWAIWWIDGRYPLGALDPPVVGGFDHGVGTFYSDGLVNGRPTRTRFIWSNITPTSARWEQAYSFDAGKTWETNWIMTFVREPAVAGDFDFLAGSWMVHHHYLTGRLQGSTEWIDFEGTSQFQPLLGGQGNVDRYWFTRNGKAVEGVAFRLFDPATGRWTIYWADDQNPGVLQPPVVGAFKGETGEFFGEEELRGRRIQVRYRWKRGTAPQWEQAFSGDGGKTWETNWIMSFTRAPP